MALLCHTALHTGKQNCRATFKTVAGSKKMCLKINRRPKTSGRAGKNKHTRTRLVWYHTPSVASHYKEINLPPILPAFYATNIKKNAYLFTAWPQTLTISYIDILEHGGLIVSALDSLLIGPLSSPARGHGVVFLGKTLFTSLHPGVRLNHN